MTADRNRTQQKPYNFYFHPVDKLILSPLLNSKLCMSTLLCEPLFFFSESLNETLLYQWRLQACTSRTYCHKKNHFTQVSLTATDFVQKSLFFPFTVARWKVTAAPIIHRVGFHNTGSTMLCSALCVTFAGKISLVFFSLSLCKIGKVTGKTKVFICAALWIWYSWIASVCTVQAGWTHWCELWRLLLLFYLIQLATACKRPVL